MGRINEAFGGRLAAGARPAVVSIDLMRSYFVEGSPLRLPSSECLDSAARVLAAARENHVPVVHTRVAYGPGGVDGGVFVRKVPALRHLFDGGGELGELMPQVAPAGAEVVLVKQYPSAFFATPLAPMLRAQGVDTVVIVGVSTSGCIRASALDAIQHGFIPLVVRESVGDRTPEINDANLFDIQEKCGEVVSETEAVTYLSEKR
ncbi:MULTISPECIES: isochorismatase family protein [Amycolatopsis]|uniref:Isochorismatase family protein n=1 Tax=Amycolatopsis alkalitolerans TaxID=2547244 RepID=A0A5C4LV35_9PSEU|nr:MULTISPECIES: isochorismatase family protein [Amycolatopsis]TNC22067.1 isochorismatase family protein [Amycolatopsis alkalitolerans]